MNERTVNNTEETATEQEWFGQLERLCADTTASLRATATTASTSAGCGQRRMFRIGDD